MGASRFCMAAASRSTASACADSASAILWSPTATSGLLQLLLLLLRLRKQRYAKIEAAAAMPPTKAGGGRVANDTMWAGAESGEGRSVHAWQKRSRGPSR